MSGHTPGPWRVSEQCAQMIDIRHDNAEAGVISMTLAKVVARPTWQREAEANARLIAAAPELLSIAREYLDDIEGDYGRNVPHYYAPLVEKLRSVISKATQP